MILNMTRAELDKARRDYGRQPDDSPEIRTSPDAPSGFALVVRLNHWEKAIPIAVVDPLRK